MTLHLIHHRPGGLDEPHAAFELVDTISDADWQALTDDERQTWEPTHLALVEWPALDDDEMADAGVIDADTLAAVCQRLGLDPTSLRRIDSATWRVAS